MIATNSKRKGSGRISSSADEAPVAARQRPLRTAAALRRERVAVVFVDDPVEDPDLSRRSGRYSPPMNEGCRRPRALREIVARHGVTRPRVFGGALQRSRSRMRTRGRGTRT